MAPLWLALLPSLLAAVVAQSSADEKVWSVIAYINNGETTPLVGDLQTVLTPEGAQQMWTQGTNFRRRYLNDAATPANATSSAANETIQNIGIDAIENSQLTVFSQAGEYVAGGAMAFFQGLYPPDIRAFNPLAGGVNMSVNLANDSRSSSYPFGGYQYPDIQTLSILDYRATAIQGSTGCDSWTAEVETNLMQQQDMVRLYNNTLSFYQELFTDGALNGTVPGDDTQLWNAYDLYQYVDYMYGHNETVFKGLKNPNETLTMLQSYAFEFEQAKNALVSDDTSNPLNLLYPIAGRTLAALVIEIFQAFAESSQENKLSLMFGSFQPMLAFFSLAGLYGPATNPDALTSAIPQPGAALVFELVGAKPTADSLSVRTYYVPGAAQGEAFQLQSLFGSGFDGQSLPYASFASQMSAAGVTASQWCDVCLPSLDSFPWCAAAQSPPAARSGLQPAVAGVVGALVTLAVVGLLTAGLFFVCGLRLARRADAPSAPRRASTLGGFKGAEKMPDDRDVALAKGGAQHERVGSWELRGEGGEEEATQQQQQSELGMAGIVTESFRHRERRADDDGESAIGVAPIAARESI